MPPISTRSIGLEGAIEKRLRTLARTMRITAAILFVIALVGGWYFFSVTGKYYTYSWTPSGTRLVMRHYNMQALFTAIPFAAITAGFGVTFLILSYPARRGNGAVALTAGIMSIVLALISAFFSFGLVLNILARLTLVEEEWWEHAIAITLAALCIIAVPWFTYMMVKGFESRRARRPRAGFMVGPAPIRPVSSSDPPPESNEQK